MSTGQSAPELKAPLVEILGLNVALPAQMPTGRS